MTTHTTISNYYYPVKSIQISEAFDQQLLLDVFSHRNLFWQLSRDGNLHGSGLSRITSACPKPSLNGLQRLDTALVGRGKDGRTTLESGRPCLCRNCSCRPPEGNKTERESLQNHHHVPRRFNTELDFCSLNSQKHRGQFSLIPRSYANDFSIVIPSLQDSLILFRL